MNHRLAIAALLLGIGCRTAPPTPAIDRLEPAWAFNGVDTVVQVLGDDFYPALRVSAGGGETTQDGAFEVRLVPAGGGEDVALTGLSLVDLGTLEGVLPAGAPPGPYGVQLTTPLGARASATERFTISDTLADAVVLGVDRVAASIFEDVAVTITVADPTGATVETDLDVEIVVLDADGEPADVVFVDTELPCALSACSGPLGTDGRAVLRLHARTPGEVTLVVSASGTATAVRGDSQQLVFNSGSQRVLEFELPDGPFNPKAGESFLAVVRVVDEFGVPVPDAAYTDLSLLDSCLSWGTEVSFVGETAVTVQHRSATNRPQCAEMWLQAGPSEPLQGRSTSYLVRPGDVDRFEVDLAVPTTLRAGSTLGVTVSPIDRFANPAAWDGTVISVQDSVGGLPSFSCTSGSITYCSGIVTRVGTGVFVEIEDDGGVRGQSDIFQVVPGAPASLATVVPVTRWAAGAPERVEVRAFDAFGNEADATELDPGSFTFSSAGDVPDCTLAEVGLDGRLRFDCALFVVDTGAIVEVEAPGVVLARSAPIEVVNGPLGGLDVSTSVSTVTAGELFDVTVVATDAYGNAYVNQAASSVTLTDTTGTLAPSAMVLGPLGTATTAVSVTKAGLTRVTATAGTVSSDGVDVTVEPAAAAGISVEVAAPWVWVGEATPVTLEIRDTYGNKVPLSEAVAIMSEQGIAPPRDVVVVNGVATTALTWSAADPSERLLATTASGLSGVSRTVVVVRDCGAAGPSPNLLLDGEPVGVVCVDPASGDAPVSASMTGSTAHPGTSLVAYGLAVGAREIETVGSSPTLSGSVTGAGVYDVAALAVASDGCGAAVDTVLYVGDDDGGVVGPIPMTAGATSAPVGQVSSRVDVSVAGATTCAGLPAAGSEVLVRTDRGRLLDARPTGTGLAVTLDATGSATVRLDASTVAAGGLASVSATVRDAVAGGAVQVTLTGDDKLPVVWRQTPKGQMTAPIDRITLRFDEPMDPATMLPSAVSVVGASAQNVVGFDPVGAAGDTWVVRLDTLLAAAPATPWRVTVAPTVTDLAGNPLAGAWAGTAASYRGVLGASLGVDPVSTCGRSPERFRPDGDPGVASEADATVLTFSSASVPAWWVVSVNDAAGTLLRRTWLVPSGPSGTWSWDGRDTTGRVVPAGTYTVTVATEGPEGVQDAGCARTVDVVQWRVP